MDLTVHQRNIRDLPSNAIFVSCKLNPNFILSARCFLIGSWCSCWSLNWLRFMSLDRVQVILHNFLWIGGIMSTIKKIGQSRLIAISFTPANHILHSDWHWPLYLSAILSPAWNWDFILIRTSISKSCISHYIALHYQRMYHLGIMAIETAHLSCTTMSAYVKWYPLWVL